MSARKPIMIGAHVPAKPKKYHRGSVAESGRMFNRAFDDWARKPGKTHLGWQPMLRAPGRREQDTASARQTPYGKTAA